MNIADRIQSLRKIKGISQEELADKIGVTRQSVSKWESEQSTPDIEKIILLSDYFEVTTDYLLKGIESSENKNAKIIRRDIAPLFHIVATALNLIGTVVACLVWSEVQRTWAIVAGLVFIILGTMIFFVGMSQTDDRDKELYSFKFWKTNVWLVSFVPVSILYNLMFGVVAPYPIPFSNTLAIFDIFWLGYVVGMGYLTYSLIKKENKEAEA